MTSAAVRCRLCGSETRLAGDRGDVSLHACSECGFVTGCPAGERSARDRYHAYYHAPQPPTPTERYAEWLERAEREVGSGRLLEVGAGSGGLVRVALSRGWSVDATEISESGVELLRRTGARVFVGDLGDAAYGEGTFDLVVSLEVLEHLPQPRSHLRELHCVLRSGGLLLLTTPNFNGLSRRLLGLRWRVIDPEHLGYFNPSALRRALRDSGFTVSDMRSRSLDVLSWRRRRGRPAPRFDAERAARVRDNVNASASLRLAKEAVNVALGLTGLGDSLLAWARK